MLSFGMSKEQKMIKDEVANLVKGVVADHVKEMDHSGSISDEAIQKAWELGLSSTAIPP